MAVVFVAAGLVAPALHTRPAAAATTVPAIPDTNYAVPSNAIVVSPSGKDTAAGTLAAPFRTLTKAVAAATSGRTIVMRGGTYREKVGTIYKQLTIQPYPHEKVWMKGSVVVAGWAQSGTTWVRSNWNYQFCQTCYDPQAIDPAYPNAGKPDMVFFDGAPQAQVGSLSQVTAGKFYVDYGGHKLYVGSNPGGHLVEGAAFDRAFYFDGPDAAGSIVRGIGFQQYAPTWDFSTPAMVVAGSPRMLFENDVFAWSAATGLSVYDTDVIVRSSTFAKNGFSGLAGNRADNLTVTNSRAAANNQEHWSVVPGPAVGGSAMKVTHTKNLVVKKSVFEDNFSSGLWADESCYNLTFVDNIVRRNTRNGISVELSTRGIVASNVVVNNGQVGLKISGATDIRAWNNTLANNLRQLGVYEDARSNTDPGELALGITWDTANIQVKNTILSTRGSTGEVVHTFDGNTPDEAPADDMFSELNANVYYRASTSSPKVLTRWSTKTSTDNSAQNLLSLSEFRSATGRESSGLEVAPASKNPLFVDEGSGNYHLSTTSPARGTGLALPSDVAGAIGVTVTSRVDRGALVWAA